MSEGLSPDEYLDTALPRQPKRQKAIHHENPPDLRHDQYTIAWVCALHIEMAAARAMLDDIHSPLPTHSDDSNTYVLGRIKKHNIVIACLPHGQYGTNNAAIVMTNMMRSFKSIRACLMVGIGGGVPSKADVRLGDIVVGTRVMQWDLGKIIGDRQVQRTAVPRIPHPLLGTAVSALRSKHELGPSRIRSILQQKLGGQSAYSRPDLPDLLFYATCDHILEAPHCDECDQSKLVLRGKRSSDDITIHYGAIASGNQVMKDGMVRDNVARQLDVICFEMETSGLIDIVPCLPIRGICDYSDSHKSDEWQRYAAATAAAYARELLEEVPVTEQHSRVAYTQNSAEKCSSNERRQSLLAALRFENIDSRRMNIKAALRETCGWFLDHPYYRAWLDLTKLTQHHGFLWLSGKPGAGKSTIMKFAYTSMKKKARHRNAITASFFFNARGDYLEKSVLGMYRSLLLQLVEGYPDLQIILDDCDLVPQSLEGCPPLNILKDLFYNAVSALGPREFTCFIDALDECDEQQLVDMVHCFEDLTEHTSAEGIAFRICFSSRHYPYIIIRQGLRLTLEEQSGHAGDLATYAASRLRIDDPTLADELRSQLLDKASGVFMWIVLVVDILNKEYRRGRMFLKKRLADIPSDLSALFKDILRRDNDDMQALLLCILWILYAKRPLQPTELYHALWAGLSQDSPIDGELPDVTVSDTTSARHNRFERYVISSSKGLAEVTKSTPQTVQFIHESVRDFLIKDNGLYELWPEVGFDCESPGHEKLKQCCTLYLTHSSVNMSVSKLQLEPTSDERGEISSRLPFLEYASHHILYHANSAAKHVSQGGFLSSFSLSSWIVSRNLFQKFKVRRYTPNASLIYVLADCGHSELIRTRLQDDPRAHIVGERYRYPLFAALVNGHKESVAALLNIPSSIYEGVDITEGLNLTKAYRGHDNRTPLSWAAQTGRDAMVKLLLLQGEKCINDRDQEEKTPLLLASVKGHDTVVQRLVESGADINAHDTSGCTPLSSASEKGHLGIVEYLLRHGADVNASDKTGRTPLAWALHCGHETVVRLLLERNASVNTQDKTGCTPLLWASQNGHNATVRSLLEHGAEVDVLDISGRTPLSWASEFGHETIVRLLLERNASVNARDKSGCTPLLWASQNGHYGAVRMLINHGADVNTCDQSGRTPLSWASQGGYERIMTLLIQRNALLNTRDQSGLTPLLWASRNRHNAAIRILVENGAEVKS